MKKLLFYIYITTPTWISLIIGLLSALTASDIVTLAIVSELLAILLLYLSRKIEFELFRKMIHMAGMLVLISAIHISIDKSILLLVIGIIFILSIPVYFFPKAFPDIIKDLAVRSVRSNGRSIRCITHFMISAFVMLLLFPYNLVMIGLIVALIGDPAAFIIGSRYGKKKIINNKTLEGSLAFFLAVFVVLLLLGQGIATAILASATGTVVENISGRYIDDNATIPFAAALVLAI